MPRRLRFLLAIMKYETNTLSLVVTNLQRFHKFARSAATLARRVPVIAASILFASALVGCEEFDPKQQFGPQPYVGKFIERVFTVNIYGHPIYLPHRSPVCAVHSETTRICKMPEFDSLYCRDLDPARYMSDVRLLMEDLQVRNWCIIIKVVRKNRELTIKHPKVPDQLKFEEDVRALFNDSSEERLLQYSIDLRHIWDNTHQNNIEREFIIDRLKASRVNDGRFTGSEKNSITVSNAEKEQLSKFFSDLKAMKLIFEIVSLN